MRFGKHSWLIRDTSLYRAEPLIMEQSDPILRGARIPYAFTKSFRAIDRVKASDVASRECKAENSASFEWKTGRNL